MMCVDEVYKGPAHAARERRARVPETSLTYRAIVRAATAAVPLFASFYPNSAPAIARAGTRQPSSTAWARLHRDRRDHSSGSTPRRSERACRPRASSTHSAESVPFASSSTRISALRRASGPASFRGRVGYLPYDLPRDVARCSKRCAPIFSSSRSSTSGRAGDACRQSGVTVAIVAGTVSPEAGGFGGRATTARPGHASVAAAAAIAEADAARLVRLGVPASAIRVLGDPRSIASPLECDRPMPDDPLLHFGRGAPTLVAGSTWPEDEAMLLGMRFSDQRGPTGRPAHRRPARTDAGASGRSRCARLRARLSPPVRLSQATGPVPLLVVDRLGALAILYGGRRDGVRRRRIRPGRPALGSGTGCLGSSSRVRSALAAQPRRRATRRRRRRRAVSNQNEWRGCGKDGFGTRLHARRWDNVRECSWTRSGGGATVGGDAGRAYFVTTPSNVTERGTTSPAVNSVKRRSLQRLRTLIFTSAIPEAPPS